jgi:hypothetical protein
MANINVISSPPNLNGLYSGTVDLSLQFEEHPTGTINFASINRGEARQAEGAFAVGTEVDIEGIPLVVVDVTTNTKAYGNGKEVNYNVQISLGGRFEEAAQSQIALAPITVNGVVQVSAIAQAAGVSYFGPSFFFAPEDGQVTATLAEVLEGNARRLGCYVSYMEPGGVGLFQLRASKRWNFPPGIVIEEGAKKKPKDPNL